VDAEVLAVGPSGKGPGRGAILRHVPFTLWGFEGTREEMTDAGAALFVNVVAFAAKQGGKRVLERRMNGTRDALYDKAAFARKVPGYVRTIQRLYVPEGLGLDSADAIEKWTDANRPWLRTEGRRFVVDGYAKSLGIPNHSRKLLERLIANLAEKKDVEKSLAALHRYTGETGLGKSPAPWRKWFAANRDYLWFSDCDGFRFRVDEVAKAKRVPFGKLHGWSSERLDYRVR
jgi:hypothetical protein